MNTDIQALLDHEAWLSNNLKTTSKERKYVLRQIIKLRGTTAPGCHGEDDCSTSVLSCCPFRIDCGTPIDWIDS
jgi:hypothetical protein